MNRKKNLIFKYFDKYCYGELILDESDSNWMKPFIEYDAFGYSIKEKYLFYNGGLMDDVLNIFDIGRYDFKQYFSEWFEDRYSLPVSSVV